MSVEVCHGIFGDRCDARVFMVFGLAVSALLNVFFGLSSTVLILGLVWMANRLVSGHGLPPLCPADDPLVSPQPIRDQDGRLEHLAFHRCRAGGDSVRRARAVWMAALFPGSRRHCPGVRRLPVASVAGHTALGRPA